MFTLLFSKCSKAGKNFAIGYAGEEFGIDFDVNVLRIGKRKYDLRFFLKDLHTIQVCIENFGVHGFMHLDMYEEVVERTVFRYLQGLIDEDSLVRMPYTLLELMFIRRWYEINRPGDVDDIEFLTEKINAMSGFAGGE